MYSYPIDYDEFNTEEVMTIVTFYSLVEDANEKKNVNPNRLKSLYKTYKDIINSKSLEKKMDKQFEKVSGYSVYKTMKNLT